MTDTACCVSWVVSQCSSVCSQQHAHVVFHTPPPTLPPTSCALTRRDLKFHKSSNLCVQRDYGGIPLSYTINGDGGFVRGRRLDENGDSMGEESATSQSD